MSINVPPYQLDILSENALSLTVNSNGSLVDVNSEILTLYHHLLQQRPSYLLDLIPAYHTLTFIYDAQALLNNRISIKSIRIEITALLNILKSVPHKKTRTLHVPICYDNSFALDHHRVSLQTNLSFQEVQAIHVSKEYQVCMLGFLPGFPYMASVDEKIKVPRLDKPRIKVMAGSVGIAGEQTGIYPKVSPGGWNIIGCCPWQLIDTKVSELTVFSPGDRVKFFAITKKEFSAYKKKHFTEDTV